MYVKNTFTNRYIFANRCNYSNIVVTTAFYLYSYKNIIKKYYDDIGMLQT